VGHLLNPARKGLVRANVAADRTSIAMTYLEPTDLVLSQLLIGGLGSECACETDFDQPTDGF
jgi:hypothetical protein